MIDRSCCIALGIDTNFHFNTVAIDKTKSDNKYQWKGYTENNS